MKHLLTQTENRTLWQNALQLLLRNDKLRETKGENNKRNSQIDAEFRTRQLTAAQCLAKSSTLWGAALRVCQNFLMERKFSNDSSSSSFSSSVAVADTAGDEEEEEEYSTEFFNLSSIIFQSIPISSIASCWLKNVMLKKSLSNNFSFCRAISQREMFPSSELE
jgi:hypothetical protein